MESGIQHCKLSTGYLLLFGVLTNTWTRIGVDESERKELQKAEADSRNMERVMVAAAAQVISENAAHITNDGFRRNESKATPDDPEAQRRCACSWQI
jgi:hypothetical protein